MTREEAKKAVEVMMAWADGKKIECKRKCKDGRWELIIAESVCSFNWKEFDYRIKPEPIYRPFKDKEECWAEMQKHQPFGWVKYKDTLRQVMGILDCAVRIEGLSYSGYKEEFEEVKFADGTPFGIKEDE